MTEITSLACFALALIPNSTPAAAPATVLGYHSYEEARAVAQLAEGDPPTFSLCNPGNIICTNPTNQPLFKFRIFPIPDRYCREDEHK